MFTTKTIKVFDPEVLYEGKIIHVWHRISYTIGDTANDWHEEYDAKIQWVDDDTIGIINLDYNVFEEIDIDYIDEFYKIELKQ